MTSLLRAITLSFSVLCSSVSAHWILLNDQSSVNFVSTKNQHISEIQHFKSIKAEFSPEGKFELDIDLSSIDSGIDIRDERMRDKLFMVDKFPSAALSAQLPQSVLDLPQGNTAHITLPAELKILSYSHTIQVSVQVTRNMDNGIVATSTQPVLISAADFGLEKGISVLQKLAGLNAIGFTVPVNFNLVFMAH